MSRGQRGEKEKEEVKKKKKKTQQKANPEVVLGKIDAHSGGCGEPLGDERLYQQGD